MQLSRKRKIISDFFFPFSKLNFNLEHFQKKDDPHSWYVFEFTDSENCGYINV